MMQCFIAPISMLPVYVAGEDFARGGVSSNLYLTKKMETTIIKGGTGGLEGLRKKLKIKNAKPQ